jgi:hydroxymethylpyrimidine pyrophosphatase-like HAD family hydrolase
MSFHKGKISTALAALQAKYQDQLTFSHSHPRLIEINAKGIDKGFGIKFVADKLHIGQQEIAAIGDSNNDLPSFAVANLKIAVKTRSNLLKEKADYYLGYKRHVVAEAIDKYVLADPKVEIKLVASDLDGTLLKNGSKAIDDDVKNTIRELVDKYHKVFVVCTGRSIDDTLMVANYFQVQNNANIFAISVNGGCVYDVAKKRYLFEKVMSASLAKQIIDIFNQFQHDKTRQQQIAMEAFVDYDNDSLIQHKKQNHYFINKEYIYHYYTSAHPGMLKNF